jgi:putative transposase
MSIPETQRLKELEKENARLKRRAQRAPPERLLENDLLKELLEKKG